MSQDTNEFRFSEDERNALAAVLDLVIPRSPEDGLPGAGEVGLTSHLEGVIEKSPELLPVIREALDAIEERARARHPGGFSALPQDERLQLLGEVAEAEPGFLPGLIFHTYTGYYQADPVLEALGMEARPPYPKGYELEQIDFGLLDPVRARPKLFRET